MLLDVKLTQGDYWKGSQIPYWLYMTFTIFPLTGLLGIDHLLLRSPWTGLLKFLTMIPLLGFWYFYDIAQATGEHDLIEKYGISVPFYGPTGIGAGIFVGKDAKPTSPLDIPRPWNYVAYVIASTLFFITPINKLIIGDYVGAFTQLVLYLVLPLAIIWGIYDAYRIFFDQKRLFEKGPGRIIPASWMLGGYFNKSALGPFPPPTKEEIAASKPPSEPPSWWPFRIASALGEIPIVAAKVVSGAVNLVGNEVVKEAGDVVHNAAGVAKGSIAAAQQVVDSTVQPAANAAEKVGAAAGKIADLAVKLPDIAEKLADDLPKQIAEQASRSLPQAPKLPQVPVLSQQFSAPAAGGAMIGGAMLSNSNVSVSSSVLIFSVVLIAFSGYVIYMTRKTLYTTTEEDDSPPNPNSVRRTSQSGVKG